MPDLVAVIDFETTGTTPARGDRATEVGIVLVERGRVVDRFQSLMRTGVWISPFITELTGITNAMVAAAPDAGEVMRDAVRFVGSAPMVAHNAAFDRKFWQHELALVGQGGDQAFACTVLLSRRVYPDAPSHKLGNIVSHLGLPRAERAHRALADAEMAAELFVRIQRDVSQRRRQSQTPHEWLMQLQRCPLPKVQRMLQPVSVADVHS